MSVPGPVALAGVPGQPTVVIADDQALVRAGFRMILAEAGIPVVAEAADGAEAVSAVLKHRPGVVLMDIRMPDMDGLEATRRILAARPASECRIIILTTFDLDQYVYAALTAGAALAAGTVPALARRRPAAALRAATTAMRTNTARPVSTYRFPVITCKPCQWYSANHGRSPSWA